MASGFALNPEVGAVPETFAPKASCARLNLTTNDSGRLLACVGRKNRGSGSIMSDGADVAGEVEMAKLEIRKGPDAEVSAGGCRELE